MLRRRGPVDGIAGFVLHNFLCTVIFAYMTQPPEPEILDAAALKALAHPRRRSIMTRLTESGPATSADLARDLGLNTGATSYHLRELARHGFVVELPDKAHGRQRWWQAVRRDLRFPPRSQQDAELRSMVDTINHDSLVEDLTGFARANRAELSPEEQDAFVYARSTLRLTVTELRQLMEEYVALVNRYRRPGASTPDGSVTVATRFIAFPVVPTDDH